ncbi:hypothetical protein LTR66_012432, partial [Elasticomyces elasticus]
HVDDRLRRPRSQRRRTPPRAPPRLRRLLPSALAHPLRFAPATSTATSRHGSATATIRHHGLGGSASIFESGGDEITAAAAAVARTAAAAASRAPAEYTHYGEYAGRVEAVRVPGLL